MPGRRPYGQVDVSDSELGSEGRTSGDASFDSGNYPPCSSSTPSYDAAPLTHQLTRAGVLLIFPTSIAAIIIGVAQTSKKGGYTYVSISAVGRWFAELALNVLVTAFTDVAGYAHSTTLRWALANAEPSRLDFAANLRLFTSAPGSPFGPNGWFVNTVFAFVLIASYVSASLILIPGKIIDQGDVPDEVPRQAWDDPVVYLSFVPLVTLGGSLFLQGALATYAVFLPSAKRGVRTWSSSAMDVVPALLKAGAVEHRPGRCMVAVSDSSFDRTQVASVSAPSYPSMTQPSPFRSHRTIRRLIYVLWSFVPITLLWGGIVWMLASRLPSHGDESSPPPSSSSFSPIVSSNTAQLGVLWADSIQSGNIASTIAAMFVLQSALTLALHACELVIAVVVDEESWRGAATEKGAARPGGREDSWKAKLVAMAKTWQKLILFGAKAGIHFLFGLAVSYGPGSGLVMRPVQIWYLSLGAIFLASFITFLALRSPQGAQPATYGHLQTLADLADDWPGVVMYWGDKTTPAAEEEDGDGEEREALVPKESIRHAGTAARPLPRVQMDAQYAGRRTDVHYSR